MYIPNQVRFNPKIKLNIYKFHATGGMQHAVWVVELEGFEPSSKHPVLFWNLRVLIYQIKVLI